MQVTDSYNAKTSPVNLVLKLRDRERRPAPPSAHVGLAPDAWNVLVPSAQHVTLAYVQINQFRHLYESLPPTGLVSSQQALRQQRKCLSKPH